MINKIKVTLSNGRKVELKSANELADCDKETLVSLVFSNGEIYTGLVKNVDEDDSICLCNPKSKHSIGLPYRMLMGWFYE